LQSRCVSLYEVAVSLLRVSIVLGSLDHYARKRFSPNKIHREIPRHAIAPTTPDLSSWRLGSALVVVGVVANEPLTHPAG
jgi:hypothetical protein